MTVSIVQISDTHILANPEATFDGVDTATTLSAVMTHISRHEDPDLMLLTGDLVHDPNKDAYRRLNELLRLAPVPVYTIPGNHDDPLIMQAVLTTPVRHERDIKVDGWRLLLLNSWLNGEHAGRLPASELQWMEERLQEDAQRPVLISLHHPPVSIGSPWMDAMGLLNADDFLQIVDRHSQIQAVIWGHIHQVYESQRNGVQLLGCPSTCVQFRPGSNNYAKDELAPGYRRLLLQDNGGMDSEVIRI